MYLRFRRWVVTTLPLAVVYEAPQYRIRIALLPLSTGWSILVSIAGSPGRYTRTSITAHVQATECAVGSRPVCRRQYHGRSEITISSRQRAAVGNGRSPVRVAIILQLSPAGSDGLILHLGMQARAARSAGVSSGYICKLYIHTNISSAYCEYIDGWCARCGAFDPELNAYA